MKTIENFIIEYIFLLPRNVLIHICVYSALGEVPLYPAHVTLICLWFVPDMASLSAPYRTAHSCILLRFTFLWAKWKLFSAHCSHNKTFFCARNLEGKVLRKKAICRLYK